MANYTMLKYTKHSIEFLNIQDNATVYNKENTVIKYTPYSIHL